MKKRTKRFIKDLTKSQRKLLRTRLKQDVIEFQSNVLCPLGHLYGLAYCVLAKRHIEVYSKHNLPLDIEWSDKPKKAKKYFKKWL